MKIIKKAQPRNLIEMAKKRRHLHLVEKMAHGKASTPTLSKTEIRELEDFEDGPGSPGVVDSQEKVAKAFGVAVRTVARWVKEGMPVAPQGKYDLLEIRAWKEVKKKSILPRVKKTKNFGKRGIGSTKRS